MNEVLYTEIALGIGAVCRGVHRASPLVWHTMFGYAQGWPRAYTVWARMHT